MLKKLCSFRMHLKYTTGRPVKDNLGSVKNNHVLVKYALPPVKNSCLVPVINNHLPVKNNLVPAKINLVPVKLISYLLNIISYVLNIISHLLKKFSYLLKM